MKTLRRKSKWRSKNQRRRIIRSPASIEWEAETRRLNRIKRAEDAAQELADELAQPAFAMPAGSKPPAKQLRIRLSVEVIEPNGARTRHTLTTAYSDLFNAWSVPAYRLADGIRSLMANAPRIALKGRLT